MFAGLRYMKINLPIYLTFLSYLLFANFSLAKTQLNLSELDQGIVDSNLFVVESNESETLVSYQGDEDWELTGTFDNYEKKLVLVSYSEDQIKNKVNLLISSNISAKNVQVISSGKVSINHDSILNSYNNIVLEAESASIGSANINAHIDLEIKAKKMIDIKGKDLGEGRPDKPSLYSGNIMTLNSQWIRVHKSDIRANRALFLYGMRADLGGSASIRTVWLFSNTSASLSTLYGNHIQVGTAVLESGSISLGGIFSQGDMQGVVLGEHSQNPRLKSFVDFIKKKPYATEPVKYRSFGRFDGIFLDADDIRVKSNAVVYAEDGIIYRSIGENSVFEHMANARSTTAKKGSDILFEAEKVWIDGKMRSQGSILGNSERIKNLKVSESADMVAKSKIDLECAGNLILSGSLQAHDLLLKSDATQVKAKLLSSKIRSISRSFKALPGHDINTGYLSVEGAYKALLSGDTSGIKNCIISSLSTVLKDKLEAQSLEIRGKRLVSSKNSSLQVDSFSANIQGLARLKGGLAGQKLNIFSRDLEILESANLNAEELLSLVSRMDQTIAGKISSSSLQAKAGNILNITENANLEADSAVMQSRLLVLEKQSRIQAKKLGINSRLTTLETGSKIEGEESTQLATQKLLNAGSINTKELSISTLSLDSSATAKVNAESAHIYAFSHLGLKGSTKIDKLNLVSRGDIKLASKVSSNYLKLIGSRLDYSKHLSLDVSDTLHSESHWDTHIRGLVNSRGTLYIQSGNKLSIGDTTVSGKKNTYLIANTIDTAGTVKLRNSSIFAKREIALKTGSSLRTLGTHTSIKTQDLDIEKDASLHIGNREHTSLARIEADRANISGALHSLGQLAATINHTGVTEFGKVSGETISHTGNSIISSGSVSINNYIGKVRDSIFVSKPKFRFARFAGNTLIANSGIDTKQAEIALNELTLKGTSNIDRVAFKSEMVNLLGSIKSDNAYINTIKLLVEDGASFESKILNIQAVNSLVLGSISAKQLMFQGDSAEFGATSKIDTDILRLTFAKLASEGKMSAEDAIICAFTLSLQGVEKFNRLQSNASNLEIGDFLKVNIGEINAKMLTILGSAVLRQTVISANQIKNHGEMSTDNISVFTNVFDNSGKFDYSNLEILSKIFKNSGRIAGSNIFVLAEKDFLSPGELKADRANIILPKHYKRLDFGKIKAGSYVLFQGELDSQGVMDLMEKGADSLDTQDLKIITTEPIALNHSIERLGHLDLQALDIALEEEVSLKTGSMNLKSQGLLNLGKDSGLVTTTGDISATAEHIYQEKGSRIKAIGNVSLNTLGNIIQEGERDSKTGTIKTASIESGKNISINAEGIIQSIAGSFKAKGSLLIRGKEGLYIVPIIWTEEHRSTSENLFVKNQSYEFHEYQEKPTLEAGHINLKTEGESDLLNLDINGDLNLSGCDLSVHKMQHIVQNFKEFTTFGQIAVTASKAMINSLAITPLGFGIAFSANMAVDSLLSQELRQNFDPRKAAMNNMIALAFKAAGNHFFDSPRGDTKLLSMEMLKNTGQKMAFNLSRSLVIAAVQDRNLSKEDLLRASLTSIVDSGFSYLELKLGDEVGINRDSATFISNAGSDAAIQALIDGKIDLETAGLAGIGAVIDQRAADLGTHLAKDIEKLEKYMIESLKANENPPNHSVEDLNGLREIRAEGSEPNHEELERLITKALDRSDDQSDPLEPSIVPVSYEPPNSSDNQDENRSTWEKIVDTWQYVQDLSGDYCFTGNTLVASQTGPVRIQDIRVGDFVWSCDLSKETEDCKFRKVTKTFVRKASEVWNLHTEDGIVKVTPNHPLYVSGLGYLSLEEIYTEIHLKGYDFTLRTLGKSGSEVIHIFKDRNPHWVYNIEVEDVHSYFVSQVAHPEYDDEILPANPQQWLLSHNCDGPADYQNLEELKHIKEGMSLGFKVTAKGISDPAGLASAVVNYALDDGIAKDTTLTMIKTVDGIYTIVGGVAVAKFAYSGGKWVVSKLVKHSSADKILQNVGEQGAKVIGSFQKTPTGKILIPKKQYHAVENEIKLGRGVGGNSNSNPKNTEKFDSKRAAFRAAKRDAGIPTSQTHKTHQKGLKADALDSKRSATEYDFGKGKKVQDHPNGHKFGDGGTYDKPHLNNHGVGGGNKHYEY